MSEAPPEYGVSSGGSGLPASSGNTSNADDFGLVNGSPTITDFFSDLFNLRPITMNKVSSGLHRI